MSEGVEGQEADGPSGPSSDSISAPADDRPPPQVPLPAVAVPPEGEVADGSGGASVRPWVWGALGIEVRASTRPALTGAAWAGATREAWRLGLGVEAALPAALDGLEPGDTVHRFGGSVGGWARLGALEIGPVGALRSDGYRSGGRAAGSVVVPALGASVAAVPVRGLRVEVRGVRDLRRVDLFVDDVRLRVAEPWSAQLAVGWMPIPAAGDTARR